MITQPNNKTPVSGKLKTHGELAGERKVSSDLDMVMLVVSAILHHILLLKNDLIKNMINNFFM